MKCILTQENKAADNLRNLILTNHGERLGNYNYGANLRPLLTELVAKDDFDAEAMRRIIMAAKIWMPSIVLNTFNSKIHEIATKDSRSGVAEIQMEIKFVIPALQTEERGILLSMFVVG